MRSLSKSAIPGARNIPLPGTVHRHTGGQHNRLRIDSGVQIGIAALGYQLPQVLFKHLGGFGESFANHRKIGVAVHHAARLGTLSGEN